MNAKPATKQRAHGPHFVTLVTLVLPVGLVALIGRWLLCNDAPNAAMSKMVVLPSSGPRDIYAATRNPTGNSCTSLLGTEPL